MNKKGFTLIELLVAMLILFILMTGFLRGVLFYMEQQVKNQLKDRASEIANRLNSHIRYLKDNPSYPCGTGIYDNPFICDRNYIYPNTWGASVCSLNASCSFETADADGDGIRDFYDPYNGDNQYFVSNPVNATASWLRIVPCYCIGNSCRCCYQNTGFPTPIPGLSCGERYKGRFIYSATTLARVIRNDTNTEIGKAVGVIVWYFDPKGNYKYLSSITIRSTP